MKTEIKFTDENGKTISKVFTSRAELISELSCHAKDLSKMRKASKSPTEKLRLIRAEIGIRKIINHYSPETEDRKSKNNPYEIR